MERKRGSKRRGGGGCPKKIYTGLGGERNDTWRRAD